MEKTIQYPYWTNDQKSQVVCQFTYENGETVTATITNTNDNPDWKLLMKQYTLEDIDAETAKYTDELKEVAAQRRANLEAENERKKGDDLFTAKMEIFEIEAIKNSKKRKLKSLIRKSKSISEANIFATILVMKEMENEF